MMFVQQALCLSLFVLLCDLGSIGFRSWLFLMLRGAMQTMRLVYTTNIAWHGLHSICTKGIDSFNDQLRPKATVRILLLVIDDI